MLCDSHQFHMCIAHFFYIFGKLHSQFTIIIKSLFILRCGRMLHPGAGMHLIDGHRVCCFVEFRTVLHPGIIIPLIICDVCDSGCSTWPKLCLIAIGVCFVQLLAMHSDNIKFIELPDLCTGDKHLENSHWSRFFHGIRLDIPIVKIPDYGNRLCIRCPYSKIHTLSPSVGCWMRT